MAKRKKKLNETDIIQRNLEYCREQLERFLQKNYRIQFRGTVNGNKRLHEAPNYKYSKTEFNQDGSATVHLSTEILIGSGEKMRGLQLRSLQREGIRIAIHNMNKNADLTDANPMFRAELRKRGLYDYAGMPEVGLNLHTYVCSECKRAWALQMKKLPKSKDPSIPYKNKKTGKYVMRLTGCCQAPFLYEGEKFYSNEDLQRFRSLLGKSLDDSETKEANGYEE